MKHQAEVTVRFLFNSIILLSLTLFSLGCVTVQIPVENKLPRLYVLSVVDFGGNPLDGATIEYTITDMERVVKRDSFITTVDGLLTESIYPTTNPDLSWQQYFKKTVLDYEVYKEGYYPKSGSVRSPLFENPVVREKIVLIPSEVQHS